MMSHNPVIRNYCRQVERALEMPRKKKYRLLDGLYRELTERFSSMDELTLETLYKEVGTPNSSAQSLMECADEKELSQYQLHKKLASRATLITMATILIILIALFVYAEDHQIDHVETTVIQYIETEG